MDSNDEEASSRSAWMRCDRAIRVPDWEAAQTILRMHHQCSGQTCEARQSALRFIADVTEPPRRSGR